MTFSLILRGSPSRTVAADYDCPIHGRFELDVERTPEGDAPDTVACPFVIAAGAMHNSPLYRSVGDPPDTTLLCDQTATWAISAPHVKVPNFSVTRGKYQKPDRSTYTDTRTLGEGQPLHEWKEDRAKVWEERRKADVMAFKKEHG